MKNTILNVTSYENYSLGASEEDPFSPVNGRVKKPQLVYQMDSALQSRSNESMKVGVVCDSSVTTCFVEDESIIKDNLGGGGKVDPTEIRFMTITDFMAKPYLITHGSWTTASVANDNLFQIDIGSYLSGVTIWANKISGFSLVRGTAVIRVMINANPFQSGMLLLHFLPNYSYINAYDNAYGLLHNVDLTTKYQQPRVEMTCRDTVMELKIPYISPSTWYDVKGQVIDWGTAWLDVFAPLRVGASATSTAVDYSIYLSFEDFELAGPVVPQSGRERKTIKGRVSKEEAKMEVGPISSALSSVAKAAANLGEIPILASVMGTVAWAARAASGVASIFGWSKAGSEQAQSPMTLQTHRYTAVSDGMDMSYPLSLIQDNRVRITTDYTITGQDEMSFNFLKQVPHYFGTTAWHTTDTEGTSLLSTSISPSVLAKHTTGTTISTHAVEYVTGAPWVLMENDFRYFRGSINLVIKIVKTDLHSGKIQVAFTPGLNIATVPTVTTGVYSLREIIDIRYQSEIVLNLPYMVYEPFLKTASGQVIGGLSILVLNELRAPESAPTIVDILYYFTAGDDFEYAGPINTGAYGYTYVPQADTEVLVKTGIAESAIRSLAPHIDEMCFGESFTSLKQLLNRYTENFQTTIINGNSAKNVQIWPWFISNVSQNQSTGLMVLPAIGGDAMSLYGSYYAYMRGGVRLFVNPDQVTVPANLNASLIVGNPSLNVVDAASVNRNITVGNSVWHRADSTYGYTYGSTFTDDSSKPLPVKVPYMARVPVSPIITTFPGNTIPTLSEVPQTSVVLDSVKATFAAYSTYRSCQDDFQFCYFIGATPRFVTIS